MIDERKGASDEILRSTSTSTSGAEVRCVPMERIVQRPLSFSFSSLTRRRLHVEIDLERECAERRTRSILTIRVHALQHQKRANRCLQKNARSMPIV